MSQPWRIRTKKQPAERSASRPCAQKSSAVPVLSVKRANGTARAGIRVGDVILAVNNGKVATVEAFRKAIAAIPKGKSAAVLVRRGEGSLYIPLKISGE
ncbi:MAG: hypothetical protein B7Y12_18545 [Rhizobiales bacterium 24-66-13]|nr:MAG: hypothetical protein B7Y12_18545 [Rhizobiales bacterium 24-66-13]